MFVLFFYSFLNASISIQQQFGKTNFTTELPKSKKKKEFFFKKKERKKERKNRKCAGHPPVKCDGWEGKNSSWPLHIAEIRADGGFRWTHILPTRWKIWMKRRRLVQWRRNFAAGQTMNVNAWLNERKKWVSGGGVMMSRAARSVYEQQKVTFISSNNCSCIFCCGAASRKRSGSKGSGHMVAELTARDWMRNEGFILFHLIWCFLASASELRVSGSFFYGELEILTLHEGVLFSL